MKRRTVARRMATKAVTELTTKAMTAGGAVASAKQVRERKRRETIKRQLDSTAAAASALQPNKVIGPHARHGQRKALRALERGEQLTETRLADVHEAGVDAARVADGVDERQGRGALGGRARQRVGDPAQPDNVARVDARDHQHHGQVARPEGLGRHGDDEGRDREVERDGHVEVALARAVGVPGVEVGG